MDRRSYIGSSDAREVLFGDWRKLWGEKTGRIERPSLDDNFRVQLGNVTEPFHLDWTCRRLAEAGEPWVKWGDDQPEHFHESMPYVISHPDRVLMRTDGVAGKAPVEAKFGNRGYMNADQLADHHMPQMQHHLLCMGAGIGLFSFSLDRDEPVRVWVPASAEWHNAMVEAYRDFWGYVTSDTQPPAGKAPDIQPDPVMVPRGPSPEKLMRRRDATGDNEFTALAHTFLETKEARDRHEQAKTDIKKLVRADESEVFLPGVLSLKRNTKGSLLFTDLREAVATAAE